MHLKQIAWAAWFLTAPSLLAIANASEPSALTAQEILARMEATYANCKTYRDSGIVKTVFEGNPLMKNTEVTFTTSFVRPDRFRFECGGVTEGGEQTGCVVWWHGQSGRSVVQDEDSFATKRVREVEGVATALGSASNVSQSASGNVPYHFFPYRKCGGGCYKGASSPKPNQRRIDDAGFDKVQCFRVMGVQGNWTETMWIEKETYLLRRIDEPRGWGGIREMKTTIYHLVINEDIPEALLEFDSLEGKPSPPHTRTGRHTKKKCSRCSASLQARQSLSAGS